MQAPTPTQIENAVNMVVASVRPVRIVLFGSIARGEHGVGSDVDLMIVMPDGTDRRATMKVLHNAHYVAIRDGIDLPPLEMVFATPSLLDQYRQRPDMVYGRVASEGRELYAA